MHLKTTSLFFFITLLSGLAFSQEIKKDSIRVFYLGGQSNMDGHGYSSELPDSLKEFDNVYIFHGNPAPDGNKSGGKGSWSPLTPGHGKGFSFNNSENKFSDRFGLELSFAKRLQNLYPGEKIALIKYSRGGTSIDSTAARQFGCWEADYRGASGINQYDHFLKTTRLALSNTDIDQNGVADLLVPSGIVWMQGESDATNEEVALRYFDNLRRLMDLIRAAYRSDDLPVVIGKISDSGNDNDGKVWDYGELVQYAQEKYARTDAKAAIVRSTGGYAYTDRFHYNSEGYIDLGKKCADAVYLLNQK